MIMSMVMGGGRTMLEGVSDVALVCGMMVVGMSRKAMIALTTKSCFFLFMV